MPPPPPKVVAVAAPATTKSQQRVDVKCENWCNQWTNKNAKCGDCLGCDAKGCSSWKGKEVVATPAATTDDEQDPEGCDCSWTKDRKNCGAGDGSVCWNVCCGEPSTATTTTTPTTPTTPTKTAPTPKATTTNNNGLPSFTPGQLPQFNPFREPWETPGGSAVGPVPLAVKDHPKAGWVVEHDDAHAPDVVAGSGAKQGGR